MKSLLACIAVGAALLSAMPVSWAQSSADAGCRAAPAPQSIRGKVFGGADDGASVLLRDQSLASDGEARDLRLWWGGRAACRQAAINRIALVSRSAADLRLTYDLRGEKTLGDLMARRISYGEANRRWSRDEFDFNRLYASVLQQRALPPEPLGLAPPPSATDAIVRQQMEFNAESNRLLDEAARARADAVRPALCPTNPSGLAGPAPDPVSQPFC